MTSCSRMPPAQQPKRIQYLLLELNEEFQGLQKRLDIALGQSGQENEHAKPTRPSWESPEGSPRGPPLPQDWCPVLPSPDSSTTTHRDSAALEEAHRHATYDTVAASASFTDEMPGLRGQVLEQDSRVEAPLLPILPGACQPADSEVTQKKKMICVGIPAAGKSSVASIEMIAGAGKSSVASIHSVASGRSSLDSPSKLHSVPSLDDCFLDQRSSLASAASSSSTQVPKSGQLRHSTSQVSTATSNTASAKRSSAGSLSSVLSGVVQPGYKQNYKARKTVGLKVSHSTVSDLTAACNKRQSRFQSGVSYVSLGIAKSIQNWKAEQKKGETLMPSTFREFLILLVNVVPPFVIMLNAVTIGLSADFDPENGIWKMLESAWLVVYFLEFVIKVFLYGIVDYFTGTDMRWNVFDFTCLSLSIFDIAMTYIFTFMQPSTSMLGMMKMLRLVRLLRLVRALHFPIFEELKQMVIGVVAGMRVLLWAVVLLFVIIFYLGVMVNNLMGDDEEELASVSMSMLTVFRCYTDGCAAFDGSPLAARLFQDHGAYFFFGYMLSFMFVTLGIFNLIMAIFIDNIVTRSLKKRLKDIGDSVVDTEAFIKDTLLMLITEDANFDESLIAGHNPDSSAFCLDVNAVFTELQDKQCCISRTTFENWLKLPEMQAMLASTDIDLANHADLFDTLDCDMCGELELNVLVRGLLKMRGPITKSDIVAVRLKTRHVVEMVEEVRNTLELLATKMLTNGGEQQHHVRNSLEVSPCNSARSTKFK